MATRLTDKQKRFVAEYLVDLNATAAARRAGYSEKTACEQAARLLANVKVQTAVQEAKQARQERTEITQDMVLRETAKLAFFDIRKMFDKNGKPLDISMLDDDTAAALVGLDVQDVADNDRYGGRGIEICNEWRENFAAFRAWAVKNGYRHNLTIDRIDNDKGYSPENCRWVSVKEQALNRRSNRVVTFNGETHTFYEWDEILGFTRGTISRRVTSRGWSIERALTEPIHTQNRGRWLK